MQGFIGKLYTKAKPTLRERPYYQNISFKATPRGAAHPTLNTRELQAIKYIKQHNIIYQQAHLFY
jgi:hypothetical protein